MEKTKLGMSENIEAVIAYSLPPIAGLTGLIMLVLEPDNKYVRFHAMQSFILSLFYAFIACALGIIPFLGRPLTGVMGIIALVTWIVLLTNAVSGKYFKFPIIGEIIYEKIVG